MIPESFRNSPIPRDQAWLAALPAAIEDRLATWDLRPDGPAAHGSHALAIPVTRDGTPLVLRMNAPTEDVTAHVEALTFWRGRGTVLLVDADPAAGAMLLERLDMHRTALDLPSDEAMAVLGVIARRLAVPAPPTARSTADLTRDHARNWVVFRAVDYGPAASRGGHQSHRTTTDRRGPTRLDLTWVRVP
ncbi:aminoglycoside phosphotransferase family protein [Saccharothrix deserti]|uniref:aminoglycoside phosphotransferase family protein n=1 Tax=Saccharothrix deserti TaxID=2593674 RepID=UPI00131E807F|nr:aminoglycoside phosphotransferase family protein [Saccharothrix deserti]